MKDFQGKTAVITGAASGIGLALAKDFANRGMNIVAADIEAPKLEEAKQNLQALGAEVLSLVVDVSNRDSVQNLANAAWDRFGGVHILCNNAGVASSAPMDKVRYEDWQWLMGVNLWGVIHGVDAFVPRMVEQAQGGHIVNTASMAGLIASKGMGVYNTTKYAVVGLSETLHKDMRDYGIGVSVLCPMGVHTGITDSGRNRPEDLKGEKGPAEPVALVGNYLQPEEVSAMTLKAIEAEELYIVTHPEAAPFIQRRFERIQSSLAVIHG